MPSNGSVTTIDGWYFHFSLCIEVLMLKKLSLVIFSLSLLGCATHAKYETALDSWVGYPESALVRGWGVPDGVYDAGGGVRYITYSSSGSVTVPGASPSYTSTVHGNTVYTQQTGGTRDINISMNCETTFEVLDGYINSWRYEGNGCRSR